jgi:lipid A 3-O-deacylase
MHFKSAACGMLSVAILAAPSAAQGFSISAADENDAFGNKEDRYYTQGLRIAYAIAPTTKSDGGLFDWFADNGVFLRHQEDRKLRRTYGAGQHIYTPENLLALSPNPNDRPYAGWLYASAGAITYTDKELDSMELQVGVVGPSARAGEAQNWVHDQLKAARVLGWDHQLHDEAAINLNLERRWRPMADRKVNPRFDLTPSFTAAVGTVETSIGGGATARFGHNFEGDFGPPRLRAGGSASELFDGRGWGWYVFAGAHGRLVARDIFLDGNTWLSSPSIDKRPLVGEASAGVVFRIPVWRVGTLRVGYSYVARSEEFEGQNGHTEFGAWGGTLTFGRTVSRLDP